MEVSDPCEASEFAYSVNGILVSDFYTPKYFDPVAAPGVRYSFTGSLTGPLQMLRGGYLLGTSRVRPLVAGDMV